MDLVAETPTSQNPQGGCEYQIVIVSPEKQRVCSVLRVILARAGKIFEVAGFELYRQALAFLDTEPGKQTVGLVITDQPDDCKAPSRGDVPLWKETIAEFQKQYMKQFQDEIGLGFLPVQFTVITRFEKQSGKLTAEMLQQIQSEFEQFAEETGVTYTNAETEDEMVESVDKSLVKEVLSKHQAVSKVKSHSKSRADRIARAKKTIQKAKKSQ